MIMEVLMDNANLKDSDNQSSTNNYTCRLPRDLNIGSSSVARNKGETDVRLLVACKTQLSSEVIRLKTETLRLQKERDTSRIQVRELDHVAAKFSERNKDLENRLSILEEENKRLRSKSCSSTNMIALQKLSLSLNKYHSYPWSESVSVPSNSSDLDQIPTRGQENSLPREDWKEVSQKLLEKMKQEMKELQELGSNFSLPESNVDENNSIEQELPVKMCDDKLEENLTSLITETGSLKHCLLEQRKNLETLINKLTLDKVHQFDEDLSKDGTTAKSLQTSPDSPSRSSKPKLPQSQSSRHSDDSFRAFFTKHLEGCQNIDKMSKTMQLFMQSDSASNKSPKMSNSKSVHSHAEADKHTSNKKTVEDDRICPICQALFDNSIPQNKFEEHVLDHLEEESASLLDQYVVV